MVWTVGGNPATHQEVQDAITALRPVRKIFAHTISGDISYSSTSFSDLLFRPGITLPVTSTAWRYRVRNYDISGGAHAGAVSMTAMYKGVPTFASGVYRGVCSGLTQAVTAATLPTDGSEYTSPWVTDPTLQFAAYTPSVLSFGFTTAGGIALSRGDNISVCFYTAGAAAQVASTSPTGSMTMQAAFMDVLIDVVCETTMPIVYVVGDSLFSRQVDDATLVPNFPGPASSAANIAGLRDGFIAIDGASAGKQTSNFAVATDWCHSRFKFGVNKQTTTYGDFTQPDVAIIATGVNDIAVSTLPQSTFITNHQNLMNTTLRTAAASSGLGINRVYSSTVLPQPNFKGGRLLAAAAAAATTIQTERAYASGDVITVGYGLSTVETKTLAAASTGTTAPYTTTVPALTNAHGAGELVGIATETLRQSYNQWLRADPPGGQGTFDFDQVTRDPVNPLTFEQSILGAGTIHPGQGNQERLASAIRLGR